MTRRIILGDTHFGFKSDSISYGKYITKFYHEELFPFMEKHNIKEIYQTGDMFDNRKAMNIRAWNFCKEVFLDVIKEKGYLYTSFPGNHDVYYKNTNSVYTAKSLISKEEYPTVTLHEEIYDNGELAFIPWINSENQEDFSKWLRSSTAKYVIGHFEFAGYELMKGIKNEHGLSQKDFKHFDIVISGHFHTRSQGANVVYVGTPYEMTWADYNDPKGFHVFDDETGELEFIQSNLRLHHKIYYDDETIDYVKDIDYTKYKDTYVKVYIINKNDDKMYDKFITKIYNSEALDVEIIDQEIEYAEVDIADVDIDDTHTIMMRSVESLDVVDKNKNNIKRLLTELHTEALSLEYE